MNQEILVEESHHGQRIDIALSQILSERFSRSQIKKMIANGQIQIKGKTLSAHYLLKKGDQILLEVEEGLDHETRAEDIPLEIIHEDDEVILVNKPAGMVAHPAHGNPNHTLVNALLYHVKGLSSLGGQVRAGLVHRLDKDTSGIMVIAKNDRAHGLLAKQFKKHTIEKKYYAIVKGVVQHDEGICEEPVGRAFLNRKKVMVKPAGGKDAYTFYRVMKRYKNASWLEIIPKTGRTHQIRVHMAHLDHPVIGDTLYGVSSPWIQRQALHAYQLSFDHPKTKKRLTFECPLPDDMKFLMTHLEKENPL